MTIQLNTAEEILARIQGYSDTHNGLPMLVMFTASGRQAHVGPNTVGLRTRAVRWLARYAVVREENCLRLMSAPLERFDFDRHTGRSRSTLTRQLTTAQGHVDHWQSELESLDSPRAAGPTLADLQELVKDWPELLGLDTNHSDPNWGIITRFVPVLFTNSQGSVAMSSNLHMIVDRSGNWHPDGVRFIHPHLSRGGGAICQGNVGGLFLETVKANQVYSTLDIVRRWRVGYDAQGVYNDQWKTEGWRWLQSIQSGAVTADWDGLYVQKSVSGEVMLLEEALNGQVDNYIHIGMARGWVREQDVQEMGEDASGCVGCKGPMRTCPCHGRFCGGCQRDGIWCICPESRYILNRAAGGPVTAVLHPGQYDERCGECNGPGPNVIYVDSMPYRSGHGNRPALIYCTNCRPDPRATELREAIERGTNDPTHEESTADDGAGSTSGT